MFCVECLRLFEAFAYSWRINERGGGIADDARMSFEIKHLRALFIKFHVLNVASVSHWCAVNPKLSCNFWTCRHVSFSVEITCKQNAQLRRWWLINYFCIALVIEMHSPMHDKNRLKVLLPFCSITWECECKLKSCTRAPRNWRADERLTEWARFVVESTKCSANCYVKYCN